MKHVINRHNQLTPLLESVGIKQWGLGIISSKYTGRNGDMIILALLLPYSDMQRLERSSAGKKIAQQRLGCDLLSYVEPFAWGTDYHADVRSELQKMLDLLRRSSVAPALCGDYTLCVDNSGLDDRAIAEYCRLGALGKNGLIINREYGTQHFIGYVLVEPPNGDDLFEPLRRAISEGDSNDTFQPCENCEKCVKFCPTNALLKGVDRCISYITQSSKPIPRELRRSIGDRLYGCSVCQQVCPHNSPSCRDALECYVDALEILALSNKAFKRKFGSMGFAWRPARIYKRNALINIGNTGFVSDIDKIQSKIDNGTFIFDDEMIEYWLWAIEEIKNR